MSDENLIGLLMTQHGAIIDCVAKADFTGAASALQKNYDSGLTLVAGNLARRSALRGKFFGSEGNAMKIATYIPDG